MPQDLFTSNRFFRNAKLALVVGAVAVLSGPAQACLPMPLDMRVDYANDMGAKLLTHHHLKIDRVRRVQTLDATIRYEWVKADSGFQCHDKETIEATVVVRYKNEGGQACVLQASVRKVAELFEGGAEPEYTFEKIEDSCRR